MRTKSSRSGSAGPLDRAAYFNAAFKILAENGADGLTVDSLCAKVGATKGSFYHHFSGTTEFVNALMTCWADSARQLIDEVSALMEAESNPCRSLEQIFPRVTAGQPHEAEAALRAWANSNPDVAAGVEQFDQIREDAIASLLGHFVDDPQRCRMLAYMAVGLTAGIQQRKPIDRERMTEASLEFFRHNVGLDIQIDPDNGAIQLRMKPNTAARRRGVRKPN